MKWQSNFPVGRNRFSYESSDPSIATVSSTGTIKRVKKGTVKIYAYAQNGVYATVTVKVK